MLGPQLAVERRPGSGFSTHLTTAYRAPPTIMLLLKVLVVELPLARPSRPLLNTTHLAAVDGLPAGPVAPLKVASLDHETRDDPVEVRALVPKVLRQFLAVDLLAATQGAEVGRGLGDDIVEELELDLADFLLWPISELREERSLRLLTANGDLHPDVAAISCPLPVVYTTSRTHGSFSPAMVRRSVSVGRR